MKFVVPLAVSAFLITVSGNTLERNARQTGAFRFANYYGNSMVLQRAPSQAGVWGYAGPVAVGTTVTVNAAGKDYTTTVQTGPAGNTWEVRLDAISAPGPYVIRASAAGQTAQLTDVLFGDVWICSGQSNMEHPVHRMDNPEDELNGAVNFPNVRIMNIPHIEGNTPQYDVSSLALPWQRPTRNGVNWFSAICWLFGKEINQRENIPVGLIGSNWGGTRIEAWMSPDARAQCSNDDNSASVYGPNDPSHLWNFMIHPFLPLGIYGALWYQGESNTGNSAQYACMFPAMINDWRAKFSARSGTANDFPFGFVQLAPWRDQSIQTGFSAVRWSQTANVGYVPNAQMPRTFMSVAIDTPDYASPWGSIHPRYKRPLAQRLVYGGLNVAYNRTNVKHQGPFPTGFSSDFLANTVTVTFDSTPLRFGTTGNFEVCCSTSESVTCEAGGTWALAVVTDENAQQGTVTVLYQCLPAQLFITGVRYAWEESPCALLDCAVYSVENDLPAPPFVYNGNIA